MTREEMMINVIKRFGHEDVKTIRFCRFCEWMGEKDIAKQYAKLMK